MRLDEPAGQSMEPIAKPTTEPRSSMPLPGILPIDRTSLHDLVTARVRELIIEGHLPAGHRINELQLCKQLGVSRTPLREALKVLASEGLVRLTRHRGATVTALAPKEMKDMLVLMSRLEAFAGEEVAKRANESEITAIRDLHDLMVAAFEHGERREYFALNQSIHSAIVGAADNLALLSTHTMLQARMKRIRFLGNDHPGHWLESVEEHEAIIAALERRDGDALAASLRSHLENAWRRVATVLGIHRGTSASSP